jgi:AcrR family transcriptional regulator
LTAKAKNTRQRLLDTARAVFEVSGFEAASISRIVELADVSRGTFYLYFESKEDVFRTLALQIQAEVVGLQEWPRSEALRPQEGIERAIRRFIVFYRQNARMMAVLEQVATYDEDFRSLRLEMRRGVAEHAVTFIRGLQRREVVPVSVDARYAATALTGMVDRFAYVWFILEEDFDEEAAVVNLSRLWYQAIGGTVEAAPTFGHLG